MRQINLLHAHGSPTNYLYTQGCRCVACRGSRKAYHAGHYAAHRDEIGRRHAAYRVAHHKNIAEYNSRYVAEHPDADAAWKTKYREAHREEISKSTARYDAEHRKERAVHCRSRRARELQCSGTHTAADVDAQYARQKGRCFWCHKKLGNAYHTDHVVPIVRDGSNSKDNLVIACPSCNSSKGAKHPMDYAGILF